MSTGSRDKRVYIDRPIDTELENGGYARTWEQMGGFWWASVEPLAGREVANNVAILATMDTRITFGWSVALQEVDERYRIRYAGKVYNILSMADKKSAHVEIEMVCKSGAEQG